MNKRFVSTRALSILALATFGFITPNLTAQQFQTARTYKIGAGAVEASTADFNGDGLQDVAVTTTTTAGKGAVNIFLAGAHGVLSGPTTYPTVGNALGIVTGDFNHDGKLDLAIAGNKGLNILLGNGDGTFQAAVNYGSSHYLTVLFPGDFNGDGKVDILATGEGATYLLTGNGDGTFNAPVTILSGGSTFVALGAADFNGDGKLDFAAAQSTEPTGLITVFLGNGNGTFQTGVNYSVGPYPQSLAIADFNGDGKLDIAVSECSMQANRANCSINGSLSTLLGNGDGTFQAAKTMLDTTDISPRNIAAADFNGDGKIDLVVDCSSGSDASVFLGKGDGTFQQPQNWASGEGSLYVAVGDFNGDGVPDLVTLNPNADKISVLLGRRGAKFAAARDYTDRGQPRIVVAGDFNGDGIQDLAVGQNTPFQVNVLLGKATGGFGSPTSYVVNSASGQTVDLIAADLNGDHIPDLVAIGVDTTSPVAVLIGNGDGTFKPAVTYTAGLAEAVVVGDFNGDGVPDLAVDNAEDPTYGSVELLIGNGDGTFKPAVSIGIGNNYPSWIAAGDFNGDGKLDIALANGSSPGTLGILLGNGDGTFQPMMTGPTIGIEPTFITAADLNVDGKLDLIVTDYQSTVQVLLGNGNGTFQTAVAYNLGQQVQMQSAVVADFNGDGLPDIALANAGNDGDGSVILLIGTGGGAFKIGPTLPAGISPYSIVTADFNNDAKPDIGAANIGGNNLTILLNTTP